MTIKSKLFLITVSPIIILLFFLLNYTFDKNQIIKHHSNLIKSADIMKTTSNLLHEFQYERGLSSALLTSKDTYFNKLLLKQQKKSNLAIEKFVKVFNELDEKFLSISNNEMIKDLKSDFQSLYNLRKDILNYKIQSYESFQFFTHLNADLVEIVEHITLYSTDEETYTKIQTLKQIITFIEYAGQERALIPTLLKHRNPENERLFYNLISSQDKYIIELSHSLQDNMLKNKLKSINNDNYNYIEIVRKLLKEKSHDKIDLAKWIDATTKRINNYYTLENAIFKSTITDLNKETQQMKNSLFILIAITIIIIMALFINSFLIGMKITKSIQFLNNGMNDFFDFLNFKTEAVKEIIIDTNDEISQMSNKINEQIKFFELNLHDDKDFIKEITQIVNLMKDGDFSEKPYFEPSNPNLVELKIVFDELLNLISQKIKEQTTEVEEINTKLSDEVYHKTIDLERKVQAITKARDIAIKAEKSKDDFLANMSHEIRTPLNAILGFVTILKKRIKDSKNTSYLNIIDTSGNSLLAIINDILDFSKIQSGKFTISPDEIDPIQELSNVTILFASKAYEKHLIYAVYIDPNLPQSILIDDVRVKQILSNLLSNAIKFTPKDGMVKVRILIEDKQLIISVQDTGIGIAKENIDKVFSAFEQADGTTTRKYGGTGLGLSISAKLAELMNGELSLISTEGKGSTFTLKLPITIVNESPKEFLDINKIQNYKIAILNTTKDSMVFTRVIKKYLNDLNILNVIELSEYTNSGYDILFFVPDDAYNEEVVEAGIPAIAMLRSNQIKLAPLHHITALYSPFAPTSVIQAIDDITIENIQEIGEDNNIEKDSIVDDEEEVLFSGNILIAEDNKTNQMLIKLILMDYELDFDIANDGVEAVNMYKNEKYDLILMDENMPNLNGLGAMEQIKQYEKENNLEKTPIIALTANALVSDVDRFLSAGMDGFVPKPIDTKLLEVELSKYLKRV